MLYCAKEKDNKEENIQERKYTTNYKQNSNNNKSKN